jgi:hypothetical protein
MGQAICWIPKAETQKHSLRFLSVTVERGIARAAYSIMRNLHLASMIFLVTLAASAQPTTSILMRTFMVQTKDGARGTAFSIDIDSREYWITARHVVTGAKGKPYGTLAENTIDLKLLNPGGNGDEWLPIKFNVFLPVQDIDIALLIPPQLILPPGMGTAQTSSNLMFGAQCEFLGYPYGGGWRAKLPDGMFWLPYTKRCTVSGMDADSRLWILDGINNVGFSGGPVFTGTGNDLKIAAVISGYWLEPAEVIRGGPAKPATPLAPKDTVNLNSGFILAYDINFAMDLIKAHPNGPVRPAKN